MPCQINAQKYYRTIKRQTPHNAAYGALYVVKKYENHTMSRIIHSNLRSNYHTKSNFGYHTVTLSESFPVTARTANLISASSATAIKTAAITHANITGASVTKLVFE